jgi:cold shock protein
MRSVSKSLFPLESAPLAIDITQTLIRSVIASLRGFHQLTAQYFSRAGPETRIASYQQDSRFVLWTLWGVCTLRLKHANSYSFTLAVVVGRYREVAMKTGTVKWFNARKGYGFLKPGDGGFNVYVHISAVERAGMMDLKVGQKINFEMVMDDRTGEVRAENLSALPEVFENPCVGAGAIPRAPTAVPFVGLFAGWRASRLLGPRRT